LSPTPLFRQDIPKGLAFNLKDYIQLVDLTGRCARDNKPGFIDNKNSILERLNISTDNWLDISQNFEQYFKGAAGTHDSITKYCQNQHIKRRQDINNSKKLANSA